MRFEGVIRGFQSLMVALGLAGGIIVISIGSALGQPGTCAGMGLGPHAPLNGFVPFAADSLWNLDVSGAPVDPSSDEIIAFIGANVPLHPDFGSALYEGRTIGIPYQVEAGTQPKVAVKITAYGDESDPGPMPIPRRALIEGDPRPGQGDRHVLVLDRDGCWLYELYGARKLSSGKWRADSTAIWDLTAKGERPFTWTSADAAGLAVFPGLARADEVAAGAIRHALRFTLPVTRQAFTPPATHWASTVTSPPAPPMGMRMRLKAAFDIKGFPAGDQVILTALKTYGMILADNGSPMFISGTSDPAWNDSELNLLKTLRASDFEVVRMDQVTTPANVPTGAAPSISDFAITAPSSAPRSPVTLSWTVTGASYLIVSPDAGPVRGPNVVVAPKKSTLYTLFATNAFGRTTATVLVQVP